MEPGAPDVSSVWELAPAYVAAQSAQLIPSDDRLVAAGSEAGALMLVEIEIFGDEEVDRERLWRRGRGVPGAACVIGPCLGFGDRPDVQEELGQGVGTDEAEEEVHSGRDLTAVAREVEVRLAMELSMVRAVKAPVRLVDVMPSSRIPSGCAGTEVAPALSANPCE